MKALTLDIGDAESITAFAVKVAAEHPRLNVLVNMAGVMKNENLSHAVGTLETADETAATKPLGPIRLTATLLPLIQAQSSPS